MLSFIFAFSSCVSKKKFEKEQKRVADLQTDSIGTHSNLTGCYSKVSDLEKEKANLQQDMLNLSSSSQTSIENSKMTIADQAKRLKDLEVENSRLKKLVADLSIDNQILKEVSKGNF